MKTLRINTAVSSVCLLTCLIVVAAFARTYSEKSVAEHGTEVRTESDGYETIYKPFTEDSWWNTPLPDDAPVHPDSDTIIAHIREHNGQNGTFGLAGTGSSTWGMPRYVVDENDPVYNVKATRQGGLPPEFENFRIPANAEPMVGGDHAGVIYNPIEGYVATIFEGRYDEVNDTWTAGGGNIAYLNSNGIERRAEDGDPRNVGGRGRFGSNVFVHMHELEAGELTRVHKIAIRESSPDHVWPMVGSDGRNFSEFAPPQGTRIRIKPHIDLDQYNLHPQARIIAEMLQRYGVIIGDTSGGGVALKMERNYENWPNPCPYEIGADALRGIPIEDFEVIEHGYRPELGQ